MVWSVVRSESQRELVAADYLQRGGFKVYLPRIRFRSHGRTRKCALFPGYLFVEIGKFWHSVRWTIGVIGILPAVSGGIDELVKEPARIPDEYIESLRKQEGPDGFVKLPKFESARLKRGQKVKLLRGPFEGFSGLYEGQSGSERCAVLIEMLGRLSVVQLPEKDIATG